MFQAGVARASLNPFWGVELTGWGYYLERRWQQVHDPLYATAAIFDDGQRQAIVIALDLMVIDEPFTQRTREIICEATGMPTESILLTCSHSHNAPAAGGLLGVGQCDPFYEQWASRQAATAAILAWQSRVPATIAAGRTTLEGVTFNRTRPGGVIDPNLTVAWIARADGSPLAVLVNYGAHPTVCTETRPWAVSRDVPGRVCDLLEAANPGAVALYVQGACGDANFLREFKTAERCHEPGQAVAAAAQTAIQQATPIDEPIVAAASNMTRLPTRRWQREEIEQDRCEAEQRIATGNISNWRETIGRAMTNRPDDMVSRHSGDERKAVLAMCRFQFEWTDRMLQDLDTRPEFLDTEVQAIRVGKLYFVANSSEFFSPFALDVRGRADVGQLMIACYANGRIGYLPDRHDIEAKSYAGFQSPKYCNQFPFTPESGPAMCDAMLGVVCRCREVD